MNIKEDAIEVMSSDDDNIPDKKVKKLYAQQIRKIQRNSGKEYCTKKGKLVPEKKFENKDCHCSKHCIGLITEEERKTIFNKFWDLGNFNLQNVMVHGYTCVQITKRQRPRNNKGSPKNFTYKYFLNTERGDIIVCKTYFLETFSISKGRLDRVLRSEVVGKDFRGTSEGSSRRKRENQDNQW